MAGRHRPRRAAGGDRGGADRAGAPGRITTAIGIRLGVPATSSKVLGSGVGAFFDQPVVVVAVGLLGVILVVIGLAWLVAQIPRTNAAKPFRLQDDAARGLTICRADVLTDAVEADAERLLGVADASRSCGAPPASPS